MIPTIFVTIVVLAAGVVYMLKLAAELEAANDVLRLLDQKLESAKARNKQLSDELESLRGATKA